MGKGTEKWEPKIIDYRNQKPVNINKISEEYREKLIKGGEKYQEGIAAAAVMKEISNTSEEAVGEEGLKKDSFKDLYNGFCSDIVTIRKMVAEYGNITDLRLQEIKGTEILKESEKIMAEIENQISISKDPYEKSDFDNLLLELKGVVKNVSGMPESKQVNG